MKEALQPSCNDSCKCWTRLRRQGQHHFSEQISDMSLKQQIGASDKYLIPLCTMHQKNLLAPQHGDYNHVPVYYADQPIWQNANKKLASCVLSDCSFQAYQAS
eukprot:4859380-Pleurochrysis_carterae.AAC.6